MSQFKTGWIDFSSRTPFQNQVHDRIVSSMRSLMRTGPSQTPPVGTIVDLTKYWKHPAVVKKFGKSFTGIRQVSGSCVWAGGTNVLFTRMIIDIVKKGDPEKMIFPNTLINYGLSRLAGGLRGRGDGSFGSTFAASLGHDGTGDAEKYGNLPKDYGNGWMYGEAMEMQFSDGAKLPKDQMDEGKSHLCNVTVPLKSAADVRDMLLAECPVTRAYISYVNPGTARVKNGVLMGTYNGRGGHQTAFLGYQNHPQLGEIFLDQNNWGLDVYSKDSEVANPGACYVSFDEVDRLCRSGDGEVYALLDYSNYELLTMKFDV